jgi:hypothetical protein
MQLHVFINSRPITISTNQSNEKLLGAFRNKLCSPPGKFNMSLYHSVRPKNHSDEVNFSVLIMLFRYVTQKYICLFIDVRTNNYNIDIEENNQKQRDY